MENSAPLAITISIAHYLSFFVLVGTSAMIDLRILGLAGRREGIAEFTRPLFPWTWAGLCVAVVTGTLEFVSEASVFFSIHWFYAKLAVVLSGAVLLFILQRNVSGWERRNTVPAIAKLLAALSLLLWIAAILSATEVPQQANI